MASLCLGLESLRLLYLVMPGVAIKSDSGGAGATERHDYHYHGMRVCAIRGLNAFERLCQLSVDQGGEEKIPNKVVVLFWERPIRVAE